MVVTGGSMIFRLQRSHILALLVAVMLAFPALPAHAAGKLVGAVLTSDLPRYREAHRAFVKTLAQRGYDQSKVDIILQSPNPDPISWANAIRKFNALNTDLIVSYGAPATLTAMREVDDTPIVFVDVYGPVETGVSPSMTTTGRNMTGVSSKVPMITLIKTILGIKPVNIMGVLYNSREAGSVVQMKEIKRIAASEGFVVVEANVTTPAGLDGVLSSFLSKVDCIFVAESSLASQNFEKIVHRANAKRIPVISQMPEASDKGALVSLEVNPTEQGQIAGDYAAKILSGKKAGQFPVLTPKKVDLVVNLRAAKALALHVHFQVLSAATRILK